MASWSDRRRAEALLAPVEPHGLRHPHELGHRVRPPLPHDAAPGGLDGSLRRAELAGDLLVEHAPHDEAEDLPLARRESGDPLLDGRALGLRGAALPTLGQRVLDAVEEGLAVERLLQEIEGAA